MAWMITSQHDVMKRNGKERNERKQRDEEMRERRFTEKDKKVKRRVKLLSRCA